MDYKEAQKLYRGRQWKEFRAAYIAKNPYALCTASNCGVELIGSDYTLDHIVPLNRGGEPFDELNIKPMCRRCNGKKRNELEMRENYVNSSYLVF